MKCRFLTDKSYSESSQSPAVHFRLCLFLICEKPVWQVETLGKKKTLSELWGNAGSMCADVQEKGKARN
jgi:hypothetical protein